MKHFIMWSSLRLVSISIFWLFWIIFSNNLMMLLCLFDHDSYMCDGYQYPLEPLLCPLFLFSSIFDVNISLDSIFIWAFFFFAFLLSNYNIPAQYTKIIYAPQSKKGKSRGYHFFCEIRLKYSTNSLSKHDKYNHFHLPTFITL